MAIDNWGNIIISGNRGNDPYSIISAKFNPQGQILWERKFEGQPGSLSSPEAIATDDMGNVYVVGFTDNLPNGESDQQYITLKYSPTGTLLWAKTYDNPRSSYFMDVAHAVAVDKNYNVYVTGESEGAITIKYGENGDVLWEKQFGSSSYGENILVDNSGNIVALISTSIQQGLNYDVVKYDPQGNLLWNSTFKGLGCIVCFNKLIDADSNGNIYAAGENGLYKFNSNGTLQWIFSNPTIPFTTVVQVNDRSNIFIMVGKSNNQDLRQIINAEVNASGNMIWSDTINHNDRSLREVDAYFDKQGNSYFTANLFTSDPDLSKNILVKYDSSGKKIWLQEFNSMQFVRFTANSLSVDPSNNIYLFGGTKDTSSKSSMLLIKYKQIFQQYGVCCFDNGNGSQLVCGKNVTPLNCASSGKNAFFVGYVDDCKTLDTMNVCYPQPSSINLEAKYNDANSSVQLQWDHSANTNGYYIQRSTDGKNFKTIAFVESKNTLLTYKDPYPEMQNYYKLTWFEPTRFESKERLVVISDKTKLMVYPNPAINSIRIVHREMELQPSTIWILDEMGRVKYTQKIPAGKTQEISVKQLPPGTYFIKAVIGNRSLKQIFIKR